MWYLYTLSYNQTVFYVGITKDIPERFRQHINSGRGWGVFEYTYWIIERGELSHLSINPVCHYFDKYDARIAEEALIRYFVSVGNKLCNIDCNTPQNTIITCHPPYISLPRKKIPHHVINAIVLYRKRLPNPFLKCHRTFKPFIHHENIRN